MVLFRSISLIVLLCLLIVETPPGCEALSAGSVRQYRSSGRGSGSGSSNKRATTTKLHALFGLHAPVSPPTTAAADPLYNRHSASDWLYNIQSFPQSKVLREIRNPVLSVTGWSFAVSVVHRLCQSSSSALLQTLAVHMNIPATAHSFLVSALGLLLVFRTNSAYQRFNVRCVATHLTEDDISDNQIT